MRINQILVGIATILAAILIFPASQARAGEFESLLLGRVIEATDGNMSAKIQLSPMSKAHAEIDGLFSQDGLWWARPDGRICVSFKDLWEGGDCGFIKRSGSSYSLTLGPWSPPRVWEDKRVRQREPIAAPSPMPSMVQLTREKLVGNTIVIEGKSAIVGLVFKDDGTFDYLTLDDSPGAVTFTGHWWIRDDGAICFVARRLWKVGSCFAAHGGTGSIDYLALQMATRPEWYRAQLRSGRIERQLGIR